MRKPLLILLIILFVVWLYRKDKKEKTITSAGIETDLKPMIINISASNNGTNFYKEFTLTGVTDQTFTHTAGRYVNTLVLVDNQAVNVGVSYPTINTVRIQSSAAITGILILT